MTAVDGDRPAAGPMASSGGEGALVPGAAPGPGAALADAARAPVVARGRVASTGPAAALDPPAGPGLAVALDPPAAPDPAVAPGRVTARPARERGARRPGVGPWWRALAAAAAAALAAGTAAYGVAGWTTDPAAAPVLGPGDVTVRVDVEHSLFAPDRLRVAEGTRVRFVVVNGDPINHELIVGPADVHARHARGTEAEHPSIPGEVSVGPGGTSVTTFRFDEPGTVEFACHLPGHRAYGMRGTVEVVPAG